VRRSGLRAAAVWGGVVLIALPGATQEATDEMPSDAPVAEAPVEAPEVEPAEVVIDATTDLSSVADADVMAALDAADYRRREAATRALLRDASRGTAELAAMWRAAPSPEVRHRVMGVLRHRFLTEQADAMFPAGGRGAIGVSHRLLGEQQGGPVRGAQVVATLPGFPGHAILEPGDVITAVAGRPLAGGEGVEVLSERVQRMEQGESIGLTVWRAGRTREVSLELGSMNALVAMYGGQGLGEPFASRLSAMVAELRASAEGE